MYIILAAMYIITMGPAPDRLDRRLWALLDDACWMVFRLFGTGVRPLLSHGNRLDRPWDNHLPWFCQELHRAAASAPGGRKSCILDGTVGPLPERGRCASGMAFRIVRLDEPGGPRLTLLLGPFLESPPAERGFQRACARTGLEPTSQRRWFWMRGPFLYVEREREMVRVCRFLFGRILHRVSAAETNAVEHAYPPLRLAEDFPLHIYGVFLTYWRLDPAGTSGKPLPVCDLEYIDRGQCRVDMRKRSFRLSQGQALLVLPGQRARLVPSPGDSPCETISITFNTNASLLSGLSGRPLKLDAFQQTLVSRLCSIAVPLDDASHRSSEVKLLLAQLLVSLRGERRPDASGPPAMPAFRRERQATAVGGIRRLIEDAAERPLRLREIAARLRMSVSTLERVFRQHAGTSPIRYHRRLRMRHAEMLLRDSALTVTQVAERLGFSSPFHFSRVFSREIGSSPTTYARSARSAEQLVERAKALLTEKGLSVDRVSLELGFPAVEEFVRAFRRYTGVAPDEFALANRQALRTRPGPR